MSLPNRKPQRNPIAAQSTGPSYPPHVIRIPASSLPVPSRPPLPTILFLSAVRAGQADSLDAERSNPMPGVRICSRVCEFEEALRQGHPRAVVISNQPGLPRSLSAQRVMSFLHRVRRTVEIPVFSTHEINDPLERPFVRGWVGSLDSLATEVDRYEELRSELPALVGDESQELLLLRALYLSSTQELTPIPRGDHPHQFMYPLCEMFNLSALQTFELVLQLEQRGLIEPLKTLDRLYHCPRCSSARLNFREVCPQCHQIDIDDVPFVHCFACGHVCTEGACSEAARRVASEGSSLRCPSCRSELRLVGTDYDRPLEGYQCFGCQHRFAEPVVVAGCRDCGVGSSPAQLIARRWRGYRLSALGRRLIFARGAEGVEQQQTTHRYIDFGAFLQAARWMRTGVTEGTQAPFTIMAIRVVLSEELAQSMGRIKTSSFIRAVVDQLRFCFESVDLLTSPEPEIAVVLIPSVSPEQLQRRLTQIHALELRSQQPAGGTLSLVAQQWEFRTQSGASVHQIEEILGMI